MCGEPETPRTHYIRIHTLLHSLPSAQGGSADDDDDGAEEEATLKDASEKDALSEMDTVAAEPPPLEEDGEAPEGATPGTAPLGHSGLANGSAPDLPKKTKFEQKPKEVREGAWQVTGERSFPG